MKRNRAFVAIRHPFMESKGDCKRTCGGGPPPLILAERVGSVHYTSEEAQLHSERFRFLKTIDPAFSVYQYARLYCYVNPSRDCKADAKRAETRQDARQDTCVLVFIQKTYGFGDLIFGCKTKDILDRHHPRVWLLMETEADFEHLYVVAGRDRYVVGESLWSVDMLRKKVDDDYDFMMMRKLLLVVALPASMNSLCSDILLDSSDLGPNAEVHAECALASEQTGSRRWSPFVLGPTHVVFLDEFNGSRVAREGRASDSTLYTVGFLSMAELERRERRACVDSFEVKEGKALKKHCGGAGGAGDSLLHDKVQTMFKNKDPHVVDFCLQMSQAIESALSPDDLSFMTRAGRDMQRGISVFSEGSVEQLEQLQRMRELVASVASTTLGSSAAITLWQYLQDCDFDEVVDNMTMSAYKYVQTDVAECSGVGFNSGGLATFGLHLDAMHVSSGTSTFIDSKTAAWRASTCPSLLKHCNHSAVRMFLTLYVAAAAGNNLGGMGDVGNFHFCYNSDGPNVFLAEFIGTMLTAQRYRFEQSLRDKQTTDAQSGFFTSHRIACEEPAGPDPLHFIIVCSTSTRIQLYRYILEHVVGHFGDADSISPVGGKQRNLDGSETRNHKDEGTLVIARGGALRMLFVSNLARQDMVALMRESLPQVFVSGDQSLAEAMSMWKVGRPKHVFYQLQPWKQTLNANLIEMTAFAAAETSRSSVPAATNLYWDLIALISCQMRLLGEREQLERLSEHGREGKSEVFRAQEEKPARSYDAPTVAFVAANIALHGSGLVAASEHVQRLVDRLFNLETYLVGATLDICLPRTLNDDDSADLTRAPSRQTSRIRDLIQVLARDGHMDHCEQDSVRAPMFLGASGSFNMFALSAIVEPLTMFEQHLSLEEGKRMFQLSVMVKTQWDQGSVNIDTCV